MDPERATGIGTDCDLEALIAARDNARRLGLARRAFFLQCNYSDALAGGIDRWSLEIDQKVPRY